MSGSAIVVGQKLGHRWFSTKKMIDFGGTLADGRRLIFWQVVSIKYYVKYALGLGEWRKVEKERKNRSWDSTKLRECFKISIFGWVSIIFFEVRWVASTTVEFFQISLRLVEKCRVSSYRVRRILSNSVKLGHFWSDFVEMRQVSSNFVEFRLILTSFVEFWQVSLNCAESRRILTSFV